ncbi:MAG: hypothetical protein ACRDDZ_03245 [Marinifilaceae bacterium]
MSTTKIESEIVKVDAAVASVYGFLSDFEKIGKVVEQVKNAPMPDNADVKKMSEMVKGVRFDGDTCYVLLDKIGELGISIVEREENKMVKLKENGALPFDFTLWIQVIEKGPYDTRMKITLHAELNMMMKMMLKGKLSKGVNSMAEGLAKLPYASLNAL